MSFKKKVEEVYFQAVEAKRKRELAEQKAAVKKRQKRWKQLKENILECAREATLTYELDSSGEEEFIEDLQDAGFLVEEDVFEEQFVVNLIQ